MLYTVAGVELKTPLINEASVGEKLDTNREHTLRDMSFFAHSDLGAIAIQPRYTDQSQHLLADMERLGAEKPLLCSLQATATYEDGSIAQAQSYLEAGADLVEIDVSETIGHDILAMEGLISSISANIGGHEPIGLKLPSYINSAERLAAAHLAVILGRSSAVRFLHIASRDQTPRQAVNQIGFWRVRLGDSYDIISEVDNRSDEVVEERLLHGASAVSGIRVDELRAQIAA